MELGSVHDPEFMVKPSPDASPIVVLPLDLNVPEIVASRAINPWNPPIFVTTPPKESIISPFPEIVKAVEVVGIKGSGLYQPGLICTVIVPGVPEEKA